MFNNLISIHDIPKLLRKIKQGQLSFILSKFLAFDNQERVKKQWEQIESPPLNWWDIPAVRKRWNYLISGDPQVDYYEYISKKHLADKASLRGLSLGCGTGHREIRWAEVGKFKTIDAYDLSETSIEYARSKALQKECHHIINYQVGNIYEINSPEGIYDFVFTGQALHHFSPMEKTLLRINDFIKPDGFFVADEFVGPTRFQWTDRQLEIVNGLLALLPNKYKTLWKSDSTRSKIFRPSRLSMILNDPSESVESAKIMPLLCQIFDVIEVREYGGTILNLLLMGIAHNFLVEDAETQRFLEFCFEAEDLLLKSGEIQSNFVVAICKKRNR